MTQKSGAFKLTAGERSVLELCIKAEQKCAELYRHYARMFAQEEPELAALWHKTALEEDSHAEQFMRAMRLKGVGIDKIQEEAAPIAALVQRIQCVLDDSANRQITAAEALRHAVGIEQELSELHMDSVISFDDHKLERIFLTLLRCDQGHVALLQRALGERGNP